MESTEDDFFLDLHILFISNIHYKLLIFRVSITITITETV